MLLRSLFFFLLLSVNFISFCTYGQLKKPQPAEADMQLVVKKIGKMKVALVVNQTSEFNGTHLLDALMAKGVKVLKVFVPEHGLRGNADAGAHIANAVDSATGIPVVSLYGKNKKPSKEMLTDIDVLVYDLQDVGVRFYTYISTLEYCMEACAENNKRLLVLDRPNPNGYYVDGPILESSQKSFVGMQAIPIVYGMTCGEYAKMLKGERWVKGSNKLKLDILPCINYTHNDKYELPIPPSPNLKTKQSIAVYPSLCLFEGTPISVGRGTELPFDIYGSPQFPIDVFPYTFTPSSRVGASKPPYINELCYGEKVDANQIAGLNLSWLIKAYKYYPKKDSFFTPFFDKLCGNSTLKQQIKDGMSEQDIKLTWQQGLTQFKQTRKKYLLYADFS